jgi:disulfide bond formation protein DsbB
MSSAVAMADIGTPFRLSSLELGAVVALCGSGALLVGALGFQYLGGYPPCSLCYWQRYGHIAVMALAWLALLPAGRSVRLAFLSLAGLALLVTAGLAVYHVGVEWKWWSGPAACTAPSFVGKTAQEVRRLLMGTTTITRCDEIVWSLLGLSMAGWNAVISAALGGWVLGKTWRVAPRAA